MTAINKEDALEIINDMRDIDGYMYGDCVSRKSVIALLDSLDEIDMSAMEDDLK